MSIITANKHTKVQSVSAVGSNSLIFAIAILFMGTFLFLSGMILYQCLFERFRLSYLITGFIFFSIAVFLLVVLFEELKSVCVLTVDETGLHHFHRGKLKSFSSVLFKNLVNDNIRDKKGIYLDNAYTEDSEVRGLQLFLNNGQQLILSFNYPCRSLAGQYANKKELITAFLKGVMLFNPAIIIDDNVFAFYNINRQEMS